tara:strand:- start:129 stop:620 length:492 start_codon:yes stop_codon:yes gene_type:complete
MRKLLLLLLFVPIVSFGQKLKDLEQVLPLGNNTFEYTREAGTGFTRQTKLLKKAMAVVEAFADGKGKQYEVVEVYRNEGPFVLGNFPKVKVTFKFIVNERQSSIEKPSQPAQPSQPSNNKETITKQKAIEELKELKGLLDLGLLTQEEFDKKAAELKKIILGN